MSRQDYSLAWPLKFASAPDTPSDVQIRRTAAGVLVVEGSRHIDGGGGAGSPAYDPATFQVDTMEPTKLAGGLLEDDTVYRDVSHGSWTLLDGAVTAWVDFPNTSLDVVVPAGERWLCDIQWGLGMRTDSAPLYYIASSLHLSGATVYTPGTPSANTEPPDPFVAIKRCGDAADQGAAGAAWHSQLVKAILEPGTTTMKIKTYKFGSGTSNYVKETNITCIPRWRVP